MASYHLRPTGFLLTAIFAGAAATLGAQEPPASRPAPELGARDSLATLIGQVVDNAGVGLSGAEISLLKSDRVRVVSGDSGSFRLTDLPPGTVVFHVRRLGYEAATFTAVLSAGKTHRTNFELSASARTLPAMAVNDTAVQTHWLDQFNVRRAHGHGTFITRADIVRRGARTGIDVIRNVPGIRVEATRNGMSNRVLLTRTVNRACSPTMYLHGLPYSGTMEDFDADDLEAVELYVGVSEIPPEYDRNQRGICGVIVVWTRDPRTAGVVP